MTQCLGAPGAAWEQWMPLRRGGGAEVLVRLTRLDPAPFVSARAAWGLMSVLKPLFRRPARRSPHGVPGLAPGPTGVAHGPPTVLADAMRGI